MAPSVFVPLMERLGGEFSIGAPSGGQNQHFELTGNQTIMPGLWLGLGVGRRFEVRAGGAYFRREWSGAFPITVFPFQGTEPQPVSGDLQGEASGVMADAELACFFGNGRFRPYLLGGVRGVFTGDYSNSANIAGFELNLPDQAAETDFSPAVGIGIRAGFANKGFADLGISYGKVPGGDYAPAVAIGIGWYFGMPQNKGGKPELIGVNSDACDCKGANTKFKAVTQTKLGRDREGNLPVEQRFEFDTRVDNKSKFTAMQRVQSVDKIALEITDVEVSCQACKKADCPATNIEVWIKTVGMKKFEKRDARGNPERNDDGSVKTTDTTKLTPVETGRSPEGVVLGWKYNLPETPVATSPAGNVRLEITIKYKCGKDRPGDNDCKQSTSVCSNDFVIIFEREPE